MPVFIAALLGGLLNIAASLVGRVLIALGLSVVTYTGVSASISWLQSGAISYFGGLPASVLGMLALLKVGECISMVVSAITVRLTLDGLANGSVKKWMKS